MIWRKRRRRGVVWRRKRRSRGVVWRRRRKEALVITVYTIHVLK